jgi:hypothetical protein
MVDEKPLTADGYDEANVEAIESICLFIATKLGDLMDDVVIIGGLVPRLIFEQSESVGRMERHVGTRDLDVGLSVALFDDSRYEKIEERIRRAGFENDVNEEGNKTTHRWKFEKPGIKVTVDFQIPPSKPYDKGGTIRNLTENLSAVITPGLDLAFKNPVSVELSGETPFGEKAERTIQVCGPGAFVILKAIAFKARGENKDAYDLFYTIYQFEDLEKLAELLQPFTNYDEGQEALDILQRDFTDQDYVGPSRVAEFLGGPDDELQADVSAFVNRLLSLLDQ